MTGRTRLPAGPAVSTPGDLATRFSLERLRPVLGRKRRQILEVGCGGGALAAALVREGHQVEGVDLSARAVRAARRRGLEVAHDHFVDHTCSPVQILLFTRSLHHVFPLARALERADALVDEGGLLVMEEVAFEAIDEATAAWFFELLDLVLVAGFARKHRRILKPGKDPLARWREAHAHDPPLHLYKDMVDQARQRFDLVTQQETPYLFRYFCEVLPRSARGLAMARHVLQREEDMIGRTKIVPVGRLAVFRQSP